MASEQRRKDMNKLRRRMDGDDGFMTAHQIKKIRTRERKIPAWTLNDKEVQTVLLRAFPTLHKNRKVAKRAGRWARIIHLYYRVQMPINLLAREMGMTKGSTKMMLVSIRRVAQGKRSDTGKPRQMYPTPHPMEATLRQRSPKGLGHEIIQGSSLHLARDGSARAGRTASQKVHLP